MKICGAFDAKKTVESGQIFRYEQNTGGYIIYSADKKCIVTHNGNETNITGDDLYFARYFDINSDYETIEKKISKIKAPHLKEAIVFGRGLRLLRQDPFETLISFIISVNNNIPRIKKIINALCENLGKDAGGWRAFPSPEALASRSEDFYRSLGCGFRAPRIAEAARAVAERHFLDSLNDLPTEELCARLQELNGIGPKVADCIALFAYARYDVCPVDTWVKKIYEDIFGKTASQKIMRAELICFFGEYAGIAQQYLFYYYRSHGAS